MITQRRGHVGRVLVSNITMMPNMYLVLQDHGELHFTMLVLDSIEPSEVGRVFEAYMSGWIDEKLFSFL